MDFQNLYRDIAERTNGDIYIGASVIIGLSQRKRVASRLSPIFLPFFQ
jgi:hypothetical protein